MPDDTDVLKAIEDYAARAAFAEAEARALPAPTGLDALLAEETTVVEVPCGTGHHLDRYAAAGCRVVLIDGSEPMLARARRRARAAGIRADRLTATVATLPGLTARPAADLVIVPNGALGQLAAQTALLDLLADLRSLLAPGGRLVAPVLARHGDDRLDAAPYFDPAAPPDTWVPDREFQLNGLGHITRHRRQHLDGPGLLGIDFDYRAAGRSLRRASVRLALLEPQHLLDALRQAGFARPRFHTRTGGLSEVTAENRPVGP
jgi:SAM-dependent methyltransferase